MTTESHKRKSKDAVSGQRFDSAGGREEMQADGARTRKNVRKTNGNRARKVKHGRRAGQSAPVSSDAAHSLQETVLEYGCGEGLGTCRMTEPVAIEIARRPGRPPKKRHLFRLPDPTRFAFDQRARFLLRAKRLEHGLSYQGLANFLNVSWGTIRKWEHGEILTCHISQLPLLRKFIDGELDEEIHLAKFSLNSTSYLPKLPRQAKNCIEKFANTVYLCNNQPELREELLEYLDETSKISLLWLVSPDQDSPNFSPDDLRK